MMAQDGQLRFVNLSPGAAALSVFIDGETSPSISDIGFDGASAGLALAPGDYNLSIAPIDLPTNPLLGTQVTINSHIRLNVLAMNTLPSIEPYAIPFDLTLEPTQGIAYIRLVHACPNAGDVDVTITDNNGTETVLENVPFKTVGQFMALPAGDVEIKVVQDGNGEVLLRAGGTLPGGIYGTVFATGLADEMKLRLLEDTDLFRQTPLLELRPVVEEAQVRIVHAVPDGPNIDVFVNDQTPGEILDLGFRDASRSLTLGPDMYNIKVAAAGTDIGSAVINTDITVNADSAYTVVATGTLATLNLLPVVLTRPLGENPPAEVAQVRVLHASNATGNVDITITDDDGTETTLTDMAFRSSTEYMELPGGNVTVQVSETGGTQLYKATGELSGGTFFTVIASGDPGDDSFSLNVLADGDIAPQLPMVELTPVVEETATFRTVHMIPDPQGLWGVDVFVDEMEPPAISNLNYLEGSRALELSAGEHSFKAGRTGLSMDLALLDTTQILEANTGYTVVATGDISTLDLGLFLLTHDLEEAPSPGRSMIRLFNIADTPDDLDVTIKDRDDNEITVTNLFYAGISGYEEIPQGTITVEVARAGGDVFYTASGQVSPNQVLTLIASGDPGDNTFRLHLLVDNETDAQKPLIELQEEGSGGGGMLRAVHLSPDAGGVDIFVDDDDANPVSLNFRDASAAVETESAVNVKVAPDGSGIGSAIINENVEVPENTLRTFFVVGEVSNTSIETITLDMTDGNKPTNGQASLRVLHASPDAGAVDVELTFSDATSNTVNGIMYKDVVGYLTVPAGNTIVRIYENGASEPMYEASGMLAANSVVTVIATGTTRDDSFALNMLVDSDGSAQSPMTLLTPIVTSVPGEQTVHTPLTLAPNPVIDHAILQFELERGQQVEASLYDVLGNRVQTLLPTEYAAGEHTIDLAFEEMSSGMYTVILTGDAGETLGTKKFMVIR